MRRHTIALFLALIVLDAAAAASQAQPPPAPSSGRLRVFLDCRGCFQDFLRDEIDFVDYVRDRTEADVHVLITESGTGSGGQEFTIALIGQGRFAGVEQTLRSTSERSETEDSRRQKLATTLTVGLLGYVARAGLPPDLGVSVRRGGAGGPVQPADDPWNFWVFSIRGDASIDEEESSRDVEWSGRASVDRVTADWKISFGGEYDHSSQTFDLDEEDPVVSLRLERQFNWLIVKSLGDHWSVGARGEVESSTFGNTAWQVQGAPAIEYNLFPYSAYTRRQLRIQYSIGSQRVKYVEETLFGRLEETLGRHELSATLDRREPWGSLEVRAEWSNYLHDFGKYRLEADGDVSIRIARGLSVNFEGGASRIRDQLSLPRRNATSEEVLLRIRQLRSGYEFSVSAGFSYTFGSIYSSIVNPRFGNPRFGR